MLSKFIIHNETKSNIRSSYGIFIYAFDRRRITIVEW